jgi:hypothetical protein
MSKDKILIPNADTDEERSESPSTNKTLQEGLIQARNSSRRTTPRQKDSSKIIAEGGEKAYGLEELRKSLEKYYNLQLPQLSYYKRLFEMCFDLEDQVNIRNEEKLDPLLSNLEKIENRTNVKIGSEVYKSNRRFVEAFHPGFNMQTAVKELQYLFNNLLKVSIFDTGVARNIEPEKLEKLAIKREDNEKKLYVINDFTPYIVNVVGRSGFVRGTKNMIDELGDYDFGVCNFDVKNLKGMDMAGKILGCDRINGDAGVQLGNYAVQEAIKRFLTTEVTKDEILKKHIKNIKISQARYGGDEITASISCPREMIGNQTLLDYIQDKLNKLVKIESQKFQIQVLNPQTNELEYSPVTIKESVNCNLVSSPDATKMRELQVLIMTTTGLLPTAEDLVWIMNQKDLYEGIVAQSKSRQKLKEDIMNSIKSENPEDRKKKIEELSKNPIFKYYLGEIPEIEKIINANHKEKGKEEENITQEFIKQIYEMAYDPLLGEIVANPTLIQNLLNEGKISNIAIIHNSIKGVNKLSSIVGDEYIRRGIGDTLLQVLYPDINPNNREQTREYEELIKLTPRELLQRKLGENAKYLAFGKRGPDVFVLATDDAPDNIIEIVKQISETKSFRYIDTTDIANGRYSEVTTGISLIQRQETSEENKSEYDKSFRVAIDESKDIWAINLSDVIIDMDQNEFATYKNIIDRFPSSANKNTREEDRYCRDTYTKYPQFSHSALALMTWSNRRLENSKLIADSIKEERDKIITQIQDFIEKRSNLRKELEKNNNIVSFKIFNPKENESIEQNISNIELQIASLQSLVADMNEKYKYFSNMATENIIQEIYEDLQNGMNVVRKNN